MASFQEFIGRVIDKAIIYEHRNDSQKLIEYQYARDILFDPIFSNPPDFRETEKFVDAGLAEVKEAISKYPAGVGELQNRGNATFGAIKTQFERASQVLAPFNKRGNTDSLAWVLLYGAEQVWKREGKRGHKSAKDIINTKLAKISGDLSVSGIKIETPQL